MRPASRGRRKKLADDAVRRAWYRIAIRLGYPTPERLKATLTAKEARELFSFYCLEPWSEEREDLRTGYIAAILATVHGRGGHKSKASDFVMNPGPPIDETQRDRERRITETLKAMSHGR